MNKSLSRVMSAILALVLVSGSGFGVAAQDSTPSAESAPEQSANRAIAFYPDESGPDTYFILEIAPGESVEVDVVLGNAGNIEQTLRTYRVNAITSANGGYALAEYDTEVTGATEWLEYPEQTVTLEPTEGVLVPLTISVPEDASPGEYTTGLAAEQADPFEIPGSKNLNQRVRWALPVQVIVPGERQPGFELGDAGLRWVGDSVVATVDIANTGNVTVRPAGEARLLDAEGTVVGVSQIEMASVYTDTEAVFITSWPGVAVSESFSIQVVLSAEDGTVVVEQEYTGLTADKEDAAESEEELSFTQAEMVPISRDTPPSALQFEGVISNTGSPIQEARISIVTYQDGVEVDRYPIMQAVTIQTGETPIEARYSLPDGFTEGTYTFEVTIELGSGSTQSVLVTQPIEYEVKVGD